MKFGEDILLEIVDIVRRGISRGEDISELLRKVEVEDMGGDDATLHLSDRYVAARTQRELGEA